MSIADIDLLLETKCHPLNKTKFLFFYNYKTNSRNINLYNVLKKIKTNYNINWTHKNIYYPFKIERYWLFNYDFYGFLDLLSCLYFLLTLFGNKNKKFIFIKTTFSRIFPKIRFNYHKITPIKIIKNILIT